MELDEELASEIADNIKRLMRDKGISRADLSRLSGVAAPHVTNFLNRPAPISLGTIAGYADALGVHPSALFGATGGKPLVTGKLLNYGEVPCGTPVDLDDPRPEVDDTITKLFRGEGRFMLTARGDSMTGRGIEDGDRIVVQKQPVANDGQMVIATVDGKSTLKIFRIEKRIVYLDPATDNPKHKRIEFKDGRDTIQGIVIGVVRKC